MLKIFCKMDWNELTLRCNVRVAGGLGNPLCENPADDSVRYYAVPAARSIVAQSCTAQLWLCTSPSSYPYRDPVGASVSVLQTLASVSQNCVASVLPTSAVVENVRPI